jgi:plasmid segregation protein ParM
VRRDSGAIGRFFSINFLEEFMDSGICSVDVGYGDVKFVVSSNMGRPLDCRSFPSIVAHPSRQDLSGGVIAGRDTVIVNVEGIEYEVGPDVELCIGTQSARILHKSFASQREYMALLYGALHYMSTSKINLLVAGLPVSLISTKAASLKAKLEGLHQVVGDGIIYVDKVLVLAQPIGGLIDFALAHGDYSQLRRAINLVIDPGFFTLDWVVSRGIQPIPHRCGSFSGGMHAVLRRLAQVVSEVFKTDFDDYTTLDKCMRTGTLRLFGKDLLLADYMPEIQPAIDAAVNAVVNSVGDGRDIDNIVLVGGGASFFRPAIERRFPSHPVQIAAESAFANVRGFQRAGEELLRRNGVVLA